MRQVTTAPRGAMLVLGAIVAALGLAMPSSAPEAQAQGSKVGTIALTPSTLGLGGVDHRDDGRFGAEHSPPRGFCSLRYDLPGDVGASAGQGALDRTSWKTFLALNAPAVGARVSRRGDNPTQWSRWSSTDDLIQCQQNPDACICPDGDCAVSGARFYPPECQQIKGYQKYRVLAEPAKVDDSFLEAANGSLSPDPVLDKNGRFLRYEIVLSPVAYDFVIQNRYYDEAVLAGLSEPVNFPCGERSYKGGDPADPRVGAITLKLAWMELGAPGHDRHHGAREKRERHSFHTEDLLLYNPSHRNSDGEASCRLATVGLAGMHIAHKTVNQPKWIWSTFEHRRNAPDCTSLPPAGDEQGSGPSTSCPASVDRDYNLFPASCAADGSDPQACQTCNVTPVSNAPSPMDCNNPTVTDDVAWCLDLPPAPDAGLTKACRQVPVADNYPTAHFWNQACARRLGARSTWSNYQLISTQWFSGPPDRSDVCTSGSASAATRAMIQPQVDITGDGQSTRPFLANTTMETYVRANCMGCHSNASVAGTSGSPGTDLMYFLQLEVSAASEP
jgi:hypothetical protein